MIGLVFGAMTVFGVVFSLAVLRADPRRWDNVVFGTMGLLDALSTAYRGVMLLGGHPLAGQSTLPVCAILSFLLGWGAFEFTYSFPWNRPAPMRLRLPIALATGVVITLRVVPATRDTTTLWETFGYHLPLLGVMVYFLRRNLRATSGDRTASGLVAAALVLRWVSAILTYGVAKVFFPAVLPALVVFDTTAMVVVSYALITFAVLRSQLFSVRSFASEVMALGGVAVAVVVLAALAVEAALRTATGPSALRAALLLAALVPVVALAAGTGARGRLERAVVRNIDPRRALRERVIARALAARDPAPAAMLAVIREALREISDGGAAGYLHARGPNLPGGAPLPPAFAERAQGEALLRAHDPDLPWDLLVPVRAGESVHGAIAVTGGRIDRDTVLVATTLADRLALRLDAYVLFLELESSRRLATLGSFAAAIAHDIRTPLTSVQMNVQILRRKAKLPPDDMEYFDIALEELDRLGAGVRDLLDFAKPTRLDAAVVDLRDVVSEAARATAPAIAERHLQLDVCHEAGVGGTEAPLARGDAQRLRQVVENLLTNAAAASPEGEHVEIRTRRESDGRLALDVADHGKGIADDDLPHIFEPFFTTRPDGTGLGLAICEKLARAHGGEIRVDAARGKGSTFTLLLPAAGHDPLPA